MIRDPVAEHGLPGIREAPERGRHVRADRLALRPRGALAGAAVEFGEHVLVGYGRGLNIADARTHGSSGPDLARTMPQRTGGRNLRMPASRKYDCAGFRASLCSFSGTRGHGPAALSRGSTPKSYSPAGA